VRRTPKGGLPIGARDWAGLNQLRNAASRAIAPCKCKLVDWISDALEMRKLRVCKKVITGFAMAMPVVQSVRTAW